LLKQFLVLEQLLVSDKMERMGRQETQEQRVLVQILATLEPQVTRELGQRQEVLV
jgi:hypothetical protein